MLGKPLFEKKELQEFLLTVFILSLIFFFFKWRNTDFDLLIGINWYIATFLFTLAVSFLARYLQKRQAYKKGYRGVFKNAWQGMSITLFISFFSFGLLPILAPGRIELKGVERIRMGSYRFGGLNFKDMAKNASLGILVYIGVATCLGFFYNGQDILHHFIFICMLLAVFSVLPIRSYDGLIIFTKSRPVYVFFAGFVILYALLFFFTGIFSPLLFLLAALVFTVIIWFLFIYFIENKQF